MDRDTHIREWFDELHQPIWSILNSREAFRSWKEVTRAAQPEWPEHTSHYFIEWVNRNYLRSLMVAIRAMNDQRKGTRSLRRFLNHIKKQSPPNVPLDRIDSCLDRLTKVSRDVHKHVNVRIAHHNPPEAEDLGLTYRDIHHAADTICGIYQDLYTILYDSTVVPPSVTDSSPYSPWEYLFTETWITHEEATEIAKRRLDEWHSLVPSVHWTSQIVPPR